MKKDPHTTLSVINDSLKDLIKSFDEGITYEHPSFLTVAQLKGLQGFVEDKVKEYAE